MIYYEEKIEKSLNKKDLPKKVFKLFNDAFIALDITNNLKLFDIKKLKGLNEREYYRLRKGKYRAIFYIENNDYYIIKILKREEVYKRWV
ncbi:MAG: hypothetical protein IIB44_12280 [Candidatus Marinimicrobia bacterium]|nr:hypothetical protein [Candidatus Neomarinimicrobiota bacterium]